MLAKYRIKKTASSPFSALTGILATPMLGGSLCHICKQKTVKGSIPIQKHAYKLFNNIYSKDITVTSICNVQNCVNPEHLTATYKPNKDDQEYIRIYLRIDGLESLAEKLHITPELLKDYING